MTSIITKLIHDIKCLAIINDRVQQEVFGGFFYQKLSGIPYYKVIINVKRKLGKGEKTKKKIG